MMLITLYSKPGSKLEKVEKIDDRTYRVWIKARAEGGRANAAIIKLMAEYLRRPQKCFQIIRGEKSKRKTMAVED